MPVDTYWRQVSMQTAQDMLIYTYVHEYPHGTLVHVMAVHCGNGNVSASLLFVPALPCGEQ